MVLVDIGAGTTDIAVFVHGAINSAALLLRSANDRHPNGLGNGSGVVGRNLMMHNNSSLIAFSRLPNPTRFQKTLGINDFYFGDDDFKYPMGHISMIGKTDASILRAGAPRLVGALDEGNQEVVEAGVEAVVIINGKVATEISEPEFFTCLMHNYFGDRPADTKLKTALLGGS